MTKQFDRRAELYVTDPKSGRALNLSELRFRFQIAAADVESPNNAAIRVYNMSPETMRKVQQEYSYVAVQAGYGNNFGVIFQGTIKQFRIGREGATESYLDILAADGDIGYNFAHVRSTLAPAQSTPKDRVDAIMQGFGSKGLSTGHVEFPSTGGTLPRGKVLFGMAKTLMRQSVWSEGSTWSITNGKVNVIPLKGYLPGTAVVMNAFTGMVGRPEQTIDGIRVRALLNPRIVAGGLLQIDNASVNRIIQANPKAAPVPYNQWTGIQLLADVTFDGVYRVFVAEYVGDTRGQEFYVDIVALSVNRDTSEVKTNG